MANSALSSISFLRLGKQGWVRLLIRYKQAGPGCAQENTHFKSTDWNRIWRVAVLVDTFGFYSFSAVGCVCAD